MGYFRVQLLIYQGIIIAFRPSLVPTSAEAKEDVLGALGAEVSSTWSMGSRSMDPIGYIHNGIIAYVEHTTSIELDPHI